ncbi:transglutaminase-like domain-containing protein [Paenibacillus filicis]|uniref:Transglutaminase-like domain-containing protein n=1 Tax=Paenibacillus filicis TaxID=669464 RepID=A0ABU9DQH2_9BACL
MPLPPSRNGSSLLAPRQPSAARGGRGPSSPRRWHAAEVSGQPVRQPSWLADAVLSLLLLLLVLEWLYPLQQLADITELYALGPFIGTFACFVLLDTLRFSSWASWLFKTIWMVVFTVWLHHGQSLPSLEDWSLWAREFAADIGEGLRGELGAWEPSTRTLLFTAGWSFFLSVVQSLVLDRRQVHGFVLLTLALPVVLQTAFGLDGFLAACRCVLLGLLLQLWLQPGIWQRGLLQIGSHKSALLQDTPQGASRATWWSGLVPGGLVLAFGLLGALLHPQQAVPLDWSRYMAAWQNGLHGLSALAGEQTLARSGYSSDDSRMGQPLKLDDSPAFTAVTGRLTYWRGETKSVYTGQGWAEQEAGAATGWEPSGQRTEPPQEGWEKVRQSITLADSSLNRILFAGGELTRIVSLQSAQGRSIPQEWVWRNKVTDRFSLPAMTEPLAAYTVEARVLTDRAMLQREPAAMMPEDVRAHYTQLPDTVPARVGELARQITQSATGDHAKAEAVETYLREHYTYDTVHTQAVGPGEDLVDRFLFHQRSGYCDHFSTAMVVLLREVGIPARWVKGFVPGEVTSTRVEDGETQYTVEVKRKDAHAWVEVYNPDYGWVAYEPTSGFAGAAGLAADAPSPSVQKERSAGQSPQIAGPDWRVSAFESLNNLRQHLVSLTGQVTAELTQWQHAAADAGSQLMVWLRQHPLTSILAAAVLAAGALVASMLKLRQLWRRSLPEPPNRPRGATSPALASGPGLFYGLRMLAAHRLSERLWRRVQRRYGRAEPCQTLREYMATRPLQGATQSEALQAFLRMLEAQRYADPYGDQGGVSPHTLREAWRSLRRKG